MAISKRMQHSISMCVKSAQSFCAILILYYFLVRNRRSEIVCMNILSSILALVACCRRSVCVFYPKTLASTRELDSCVERKNNSSSSSIIIKENQRGKNSHEHELMHNEIIFLFVTSLTRWLTRIVSSQM